MQSFKNNEYTIHVCTDIIEWAKEFYDMPDNAELENKEEVSSECMGFAEIDSKTIWIFVPVRFNLLDLKSTIAHEIGHIIEFNHASNPPQTEENDNAHEQKADFFMNYYLLIDKITDEICLKYLLPNLR